MNRRAKHYHRVNSNLVPTITRRKERLTRIAANKRKRDVGLRSNQLAGESILLDDRFIGRDGWPISLRAYIRHIEDPTYRTVACDWYRGIRVSTVWMGKFWPLGFGPDSYFLFETIVFVDGKGADQRRYKTEAEARQGHAYMLAGVKKLMTPRNPGTRMSDAEKAIHDGFRKLLLDDLEGVE